MPGAMTLIMALIRMLEKHNLSHTGLRLVHTQLMLIYSQVERSLCFTDAILGSAFMLIITAIDEQIKTNTS